MNQSAPTRVDVENPRGFLSARVDANGRIKLPARFIEYLEELPSKRMYITQINGMARIYMNGSWERTLDQFTLEPKKRKALELVAAKYGEDVEADKTGKITLPQALRRELKLEGEMIQMLFDRDVARIYSTAQHDAATEAAEAYVAGFIGEAEDLGQI